MKKMIATILSIVMMAAVFAGCNSGNTNDSGEQTYKLGILQYANHGSLDNCREGFLEGLKEEGIEEGKNLEIDLQNPQGDTNVNNQMAQAFVSQGVDMICAIATPSAQAAYNAASTTDIPVIYTAVNDPVASQLANEDKTPVGNVTGTSDSLPVEEQLKLIRAMMPDAKNIGILYTTSETNSISCIETYKELAGKYGFTIIEKGISTSADIPLAVDALLPQVDCLTNLTDNNVVNNLAVVLDKANAQNIPVFGSEIEQVKNGCVAAAGLDYVELGKQTGRMAAKVLKGEAKASELSFELIEGSSLYVNEAVMQQLGLSLPEDYAQQAEKVSAE